MKVITLLALGLLVPQLAVARVYMCVDDVTGEASFTDKACASDGSREEVKVDATNLNSGANYGSSKGKDKSWTSEHDNRKSGVDLSAERLRLYENKASASAD
jgi:hypothetical protein